MEKVTPKKVNWTPELEQRFADSGFASIIIEELKMFVKKGNGEVYQAGDLQIITRVEMLNEHDYEVVWMASIGRGLKQWAQTFFDGAKRAGAKSIRFHIDESSRRELLILRVIGGWKPERVEGWDNDPSHGVYRVNLGGD
ncbi:hypothetical protein [Vibrio europaeus]|uniref:hypothetical protein n=1 Tax=Vibrio europaeus TaxID=300876 RepID=UPI0039DFFD7E